MDFKNNVLELVGNTPLIKLQKLNIGLKPQIFAKLESYNPGGSVKDRIGIAMLNDAIESGLISEGGTIVEATSGNTGIGLALAALVKGFKSVFVVTDKVSFEKINYLKALGSEVIVCPFSAKHDSESYYVNVARRVANETPNSIFMYQYSNPSNPQIHYQTTGPEIWNQTDGKITHFVAGIGTGGTISGVGKYLKEKNPNIKIIGADPFGSIFKTYKEKGEMSEGFPYFVEGIGQDCIPENVHFQYIDSVMNITDADSFLYSRKLSKEEGIFCGGSTGTILKAALDLAVNLTENDIIVFIVCDTGERYLSKFHNEEWLKEKRLLKEEIKSLRDISYSKKRKNGSQLVFIKSNDKVRSVVEMLNKGFSQIPVIENGKSIGSVRESIMTNLIANPNMLDSNVQEIMEESFPCLDEECDLHIVKKHLTEHPAVIVTSNEIITDIITRYDVLEAIEI